jgi:hypothetical protein
VVKDSNDKTLKYQYAPNGEMSRIHQVDGITILSSNGLIVRPGSTGIFEMAPGSDNKLVKVNLAAQTTKPYGSINKTVSVNGASKLFLFRGGE